MRNAADKRSIGNSGEDAVCDMLTRHGYEILRRNFTVRGGEIDIIARKGEVVCFVEVKSRKQGSLEAGEEAINKTKRERIIRTAQRFLLTLQDDPRCRFDAAVVTLDKGKASHIKYYPGAFDASR